MQNEIFMAGPHITDSDIEIVVDALKNGWYGKNAYHYVERFESEFAHWHDRDFALMTPNCTHAIHLLLKGLDIGPGDEVIVPDITWIATAAPIVYLGATPVFADVDQKTWCLNPETIKAKITKKTKAVIVVDLYGNMPDMLEIEKICEEYSLYLIEDSAEALGSELNSRRAGSFGIGSVFSFHRTKTLTTGEGGMLLLDDEKLFQRCKFLSDHGRTPGGYYNTEVTFKYMPSNLAASLGYAQFLRLDQLVEKKIWIWSKYSEFLASNDKVQLNPVQKGVKNSYWSSVLLIDEKSGHNRDSVLSNFARLNLPARPFFYPLSELPAFKSFLPENSTSNFHAKKLSQSGVCLPSALNMTEAQIYFVSETIQKIVR